MQSNEFIEEERDLYNEVLQDLEEEFTDDYKITNQQFLELTAFVPKDMNG